MGNFRFFDAPVVAFFMLPDGFGLREACDLGMFTQTVMLGLTAQGLGSCLRLRLASWQSRFVKSLTFQSITS